MGRIACGYIARFELAVRARREPELWQRPVAVGDIAAKRGRILAATAPAERRGVRAGLPLTEALALCPQLELIAPDPAGVNAAGQEIRSALGKLSPAIDSDGLGAFFVTAEGLEQIHADEMVLARRLRAAFQDLGYDARIGMADRSLAAWVAARRSTGITRVEPGQDTQALADVRVGTLGLPPPVLERFDLLGIRTVASSPPCRPERSRHGFPKAPASNASAEAKSRSPGRPMRRSRSFRRRSRSISTRRLRIWSRSSSSSSRCSTSCCREWGNHAAPWRSCS